MTLQPSFALLPANFVIDFITNPEEFPASFLQIFPEEFKKKKEMNRIDRMNR